MENKKEIPEKLEMFNEESNITGAILDYPNVVLSSNKGKIIFSNLS